MIQTCTGVYLFVFYSEQLFWDSPAQLAFSKLQMCQRKMKTALVRRTFQRADDVRSAITRDDVSLPAIPGIGDDQQTLGFHLFHREEVDVVQECVPISGHSSRDHGVTAHSPDCDAPIRWPPLYPSLTRSRCLNPGIRINPTVPPCAPELRDFFFTYLEISLVKPCGFLWWARFLRFDLGLAVPAWSLIGRAHMSTLIRYSMQEKISLWRKSWSRSKDKFVTICQVASAQSNYAGRLVEPSCCKSHATNCT